VGGRFNIVIPQFRVAIATDCRALTSCLNVNYVVGNERASSLFLHCVVSILYFDVGMWNVVYIYKSEMGWLTFGVCMLLGDGSGGVLFLVSSRSVSYW
jgi:hypothetical protein